MTINQSKSGQSNFSQLIVSATAAAAGLQASTVAIVSLGGRVPQIWMNYQRGDSGELSIATCMLNLAGNVARVFTTLVLTKVTILTANKKMMPLSESCPYMMRCQNP